MNPFRQSRHAQLIDHIQAGHSDAAKLTVVRLCRALRLAGAHV